MWFGGLFFSGMGWVSCQSPTLDTAVTVQTPVVTTEPPKFQQAILEPPFEHGNAIWAGVAIFDFDNDGWMDLYFTNGVAQPDALYQNNQDGTFTNVAVQAGVDSYDQIGAVTAGDVDNDGDADLVVALECSLGSFGGLGGSLGDGSWRLLRNQGDGTFTEESISFEQDHFQGTGFCPVSVDFVDVNNDGWLDLVASNGIDSDVVFPWVFQKTADEAMDFIILNDGMGQIGPDLIYPYQENSYLSQFPVTFTSVFVSIIGNDSIQRISGLAGDVLRVHKILSNLQFQSSNELSGKRQGLWMGLALADFDGDLDFDIYATNQGLSPLLLGYDNIPHSPYTEAPIDGWYEENVNPFHTLFENQNGQLVERVDWPLDAPQLLPGDLFDGLPDSTGTPIYPEWMNPQNLERYGWAWGAVALDADADGWVDVAFNGNNCSAPMNIIWSESQGAGPGALLLNQGGTGFKDVTAEWGIENQDTSGRYQDGRGIAVGDLNNDGFADLVYVNRSYNPSQSGPLEQIPGTPQVWLSTPRDNHWLRLKLEGTQSNRDAVGAIVEIDDGTREHLFSYGAGGATNSSSDLRLLVGLGGANTVDVKITFPSGIVVEEKGVSVDQELYILESD